MVLKFLLIVVSIVTIVLASIVIGGMIIVGHILENDPNISNEIRQWLGAGGGEEEDFEQNSQERSSSSLPPTLKEGNVISIVGNSESNSYSPNPVEIKVSDTVTWINNDSSPHTVTSSNDETFDSDVLRRGETLSFTFDNEGEYPYFCTLHPSMVGTVIVTAS